MKRKAEDCTSSENSKRLKPRQITLLVARHPLAADAARTVLSYLCLNDYGLLARVSNAYKESICAYFARLASLFSIGSHPEKNESREPYFVALRLAVASCVSLKSLEFASTRHGL